MPVQEIKKIITASVKPSLHKKIMDIWLKKQEKAIKKGENVPKSKVIEKLLEKGVRAEEIGI